MASDAVPWNIGFPVLSALLFGIGVALTRRRAPQLAEAGSR